MNAASVLSYLMSREWAMHAPRLMELSHAAAVALEVASPEAIAAAQAKAAARTNYAGDGYDVRDGVAHIQILGPMLKEVPCIFELMGIEATSTVAVKAALEAAFADDDVKAISLDIDSPGGSLSGIQELADTVYSIRGEKPIVAHVSDLSASAAYWVASQTDKVTANESALVGSIGVYSVMEDSSAAAAKAGIQVHVLRSHELKGAGIDGAPLTTAQITDGQRIVDAAADMFIAAVARGRGLSTETVKGMATGQVWFGAEARDRRLIDAVASKDDAHKSVAASRSPVSLSQTKEIPMSDKKTVEQLTAELAAKEAALAAKDVELKAAHAQTKAVETARRDELIAKYRDRIAPTDLKAIEEYGQFCGTDLAKFESYLKAFPPLTRAVRQSTAPTVGQLEEIVAAAEGIASIVGFDPRERKQNGGEAGAKQVSKWLGISTKKIDAYAQVKGVRADGSMELFDGTTVTRAEFNQANGL